MQLTKKFIMTPDFRSIPVDLEAFYILKFEITSNWKLDLSYAKLKVTKIVHITSPNLQRWEERLGVFGCLSTNLFFAVLASA